MLVFFLARGALPLELLLAASGASGDVVATYDTGIGRRVMEASADGWFRSEDRPLRHKGDPQIYFLTNPQGERLRVFRREEQWVVAMEADYSAWQNRLRAPSPDHQHKRMFVATGAEKVGSWTGTAYRIQGQCRAWSRIVVMRGPGLRVLGRALRRDLLAAAATEAGPMLPCFRQAIDLIGEGVVLSVDDPPVKLETLELRKIDPIRFKLPSRPLSRAALFEMMEGDSAPATPPTSRPSTR